MKKDILQMAKGVRDFGPAEKILRNRITDNMRTVFESFGYVPIETPIIERYELLASKFGQGEESDSMKETFKLTDQGGRNLVLRNEFTVPFARFVGTNPNLKMPFKRYQMGQIYRDGPIKLGRYREFWQCDIDIVGNPEVTADVEIIQVAQKIFKTLDLEVNIYINNRKFLNALMAKYNIPEKLQTDVIISIDKLDKIGVQGVLAELKEKNIDTGKELLEILAIEGNNSEKLEKLIKILGDNDGLQEIEQVLNYLPDDSNIIFLPSLARGLAYYTGNVFEVFLKDKNQLSSSLAGGGRYDKMIGGFLDSKEDIPAVGIGIGLETIMDAIVAQKQDIKSNTADIYVIPLGKENIKPAIIVSEAIRSEGFNVDIDLQAKKMKKSLEYANTLNIPYVILLGSDEVEQEKVLLKNMKTGEQNLINTGQISKFVTK